MLTSHHVVQAERTVDRMICVCCQRLSADIDECLEDVCGNNGTCTNNAGSFECECTEGYKADMNFRPVCQGLYSTTYSILDHSVLHSTISNTGPVKYIFTYCKFYPLRH